MTADTGGPRDDAARGAAPETAPGAAPHDVPRSGGHGRFREFRPTTFAVRHGTSILVLLFMIAVMGVLAYTRVPKEASPEITIPMVSISTVYPGVAPKDMETLVTRVIEEKLNTIPDIRQLTSTSVQGYSNVLVEFGTEMDMNEALQKVREKLDLARPELPADAEEPFLTEFNFADFPVMQVNIAGEYGLVRLKEVAEELKQRLEQIPALLEVRLSGGLEREVRVEIDLARLQYYELAFGDVIDAIRDEHVTIPGGGIDVGSQEFLVRIAGEFEDPRLLEDIVVVTKQGRPIYLRDVASVDFGFKERDTYARLNGAPVVTLDVVKRSGYNIIETADAVKAAIAELEPRFPPTTTVRITGDQSKMIRSMVSSLENNIISGLILVVAVLLFFLGPRNASFVAISIPLSMLLSFVVMDALGFSMNMVVLFSLILALGMLVDNAIVVVENIYRFREEGHDGATAAIRATGEVARPIIASTLTTLGAFLPLVFWPGIAGEFMGFLPKTLIITLSSSLFVALVIVPVLAALFMRVDGAPSRPLTPAARWTAAALAGVVLLGIAASNVLSAVLLAAAAAGLIVLHRRVLSRTARWFQRSALPRAIAAYERQLRWALDHRLVVLGSAAAVLITMFVVFGRFNAGVEYFPESVPPSNVLVRVSVPAGTNASFTNAIAERLERELASFDGMQDVESVVATVRASTGGIAALFAGGADANVALAFVDFEDREADGFVTLQQLQQRLGRDIAGADIRVEKEQMGPPGGKPINLELVGPDSEVLKSLAARALAILKAAPVYARLEGLDSDVSRGRPELVVEVDREKAALYGVSTAKIGTTIRTAIQGAEAARFRWGKDEYDIVVRLAEPYRSDLEALRDFTVVGNDGNQVPLSSVARWHVDEGLGSVRRKNLDRAATISSDARTGENSNAVLAAVRETLADFEGQLPPGYTMRYTGQQEDQQEAQEFLSFAFLIALLLIGFILVSQFNSVVKPVIILTSVVMSTVGVLLGLLVFRMPFGIIMTGVGVISLAGVVVNNAIVLIDYVDVLRERDGLSRRDALVRGGMTRFRPVVLTAITTVLGLLPLAIGFNFDFFGLFRSLEPNIFWGGEQAAWWGSMAIAVIAGLTFATILTLVLVPVMYSLTEDAADFFRRHYAGGDTGAAARPPAAATVAELGRVLERERDTAAARVGAGLPAS